MTPVPSITTPRFTMRPLQKGDEAALFPTLSDTEQCRYLSHPPFKDEEQLWDWLAAPDWPGRSWIAVDEMGEVAGRFVAVPSHAEAVFEIGYIVCMDRQGEGIASECAKALIQHLWQEGARKLTAELDTRNTASIRLIEKLGFTREAHFREHEETHIGMCDVYWYGMLRREV
ncbi:MAG: GNAT family protein [Pseudomonadota bacterium]